MSSQSTTMLVVLLVCCCLSSAIAGGLWGTNVLCDTTSAESQLVGMNCASVYESSGSPSTGSPGPEALTPKQILLNSGQVIVGETEVDCGGAGPKPFTTKPTGVPTSGKVEYTVSFDILVSSQGAAIPAGVWGHPDTLQDRSPAFFLYPSNSNKFHYVHKPQSAGYSTLSTKTYTPGTYANFTVVANGSSLKTWVDGVADAVVTGGEPMQWSTSTEWIWNGSSNIPIGAVKVKNFYWFNKALTDAEVSTLTGTTSTYMPQPLSMGTSAYVKEMYMNY